MNIETNQKGRICHHLMDKWLIKIMSTHNHIKGYQMNDKELMKIVSRNDKESLKFL